MLNHKYKNGNKKDKLPPQSISPSPFVYQDKNLAIKVNKKKISYAKKYDENVQNFIWLHFDMATFFDNSFNYFIFFPFINTIKFKNSFWINLYNNETN